MRKFVVFVFCHSPSSPVFVLPNLQLLAGTANIEKQDGLPAEWIDTAFPIEHKRAAYLAENDLDGLPLDLADFTSFFEQRKRRIRTRLLATLGAAPGSLLETQDRD